MDVEKDMVEDLQSLGRRRLSDTDKATIRRELDVRMSEAPPRPRKNPWFAVGATAAAVVMVGVGGLFSHAWHLGGSSTLGPGPAPSVAVKPLRGPHGFSQARTSLAPLISGLYTVEGRVTSVVKNRDVVKSLTLQVTKALPGAMGYTSLEAGQTIKVDIEESLSRAGILPLETGHTLRVQVGQFALKSPPRTVWGSNFSWITFERQGSFYNRDGKETPGPTPSYPKVVQDALSWASARTQDPLGAPSWLPGLPASDSGKFLSPEATISQQGWSIGIVMTSHQDTVNGPQISAASSKPFVSWGLNVLIGGQLKGAKTASGRLSLLESYSTMGPWHPPVQRGTSHTVALGDGVTGTLYHDGNLVWMDGKWTVIMQNGVGSSAVSEAKSVVRYLHQVSLPPHPGLVAINGDSAMVDWINGTSLYGLNGGQVPVKDVLRMAASWQRFSQ